MEHTKVSIVLPCYRSEAFISDIIRDVQAQDYVEWELIVVGNGDGQSAQKKIVDEISAADPRVKYSYVERKGVSRARNFGIERATGEWIAFVDADDRVPTNWLRRYVGCIDGKADMIAGGISRRDVESGRLTTNDLLLDEEGLRYTEPSEFVPVFISDMAVMYSPCSKIFRLEFLKTNGLRFDESLTVYEDGVFCLEAALACSSMTFVRQSGYEYCEHGNVSAIGRYHASMEAALEKRRGLIARLFERGRCSGKEEKLNLQRAADALDVVLNSFRRGSPLGFSRKKNLVRRIYSDPVLGMALNSAVVPDSNRPLRLFCLLKRMGSASLCVIVFSFLFWIKSLGVAGKRQDTPVFSFCMLTWNRSPMLKVCLHSFLDRISGDLPYELIVMDNASTDGTKDVLKEFESHPNVRIVLNHKNLRLNAYKPLFGLARGRYMVDLDDDILEFPRDFDKLFLDYFKAFPDYGFLCLNVVQNDKTLGHKPEPECYTEDRRGEKIVEEGPCGGWCAAFRRSHYNLFKFFFNRMNLSISRVEGGVLSGFLHVVLRRRQGVIKEAVCLHATGPYYAEQFGLLKREQEKYEAAGLIKEAGAFGKRGPVVL